MLPLPVATPEEARELRALDDAFARIFAQPKSWPSGCVPAHIRALLRARGYGHLVPADTPTVAHDGEAAAD